jgi:cysteine-rich repeat protein
MVRSTAAATSTYNFAPQLGAPANVKVAGTPAINGGAAPFDGVKPLVISWDASPTATRYYVLIQHVTVDAGGHASNAIVATFHTAQTSLPIPASLFIKGDFYYFRVGAFHSPIDYQGGHLVELGFPLDEARTATGMMRLSSLCGNSVKDPGEQCDTGGDSPTCDSDCSLVICGDGHVNAKANEQCDDIGFGSDTAFCTTTCKVPVCGDGEWDYQAGEQCDDGNTTSGDGCSSTCTLEGCGNGTVDNFEGCDDGNKNAGDGCSPQCQAELGWTCTSASPSVCTRM